MPKRRGSVPAQESAPGMLRSAFTNLFSDDTSRPRRQPPSGAGDKHKQPTPQGCGDHSALKSSAVPPTAVVSWRAATVAAECPGGPE